MSLFNRPIPLVIEEFSEVPISSNQNDQENEQSEDDEDEEIDSVPEDDVIDVIGLGEQVEESIKLRNIYFTMGRDRCQGAAG